jgi:hypothetical protein
MHTRRGAGTCTQETIKSDTSYDNQSRILYRSFKCGVKGGTHAGGRDSHKRWGGGGWQGHIHTHGGSDTPGEENKLL